ncbi:MAG: transglycosylase domain-containing protein, partial [Microgenomates group bacterium]
MIILKKASFFNFLPNILIVFYFNIIPLYSLFFIHYYLYMAYLSPRYHFRQKYLKQRLVAYGLIFATGVILLGFIFSFIIFAWYAKDLPSPGKLSIASSYSTVFLDRDGKILYEIYKDKNRVPVTFNEIPDSLKKATIAIEDKNFYRHKGISELGILRAFVNIILKRRLEGGSTITQQLIKNVLLDSRRTLSRKIKEMILAFEVERRYSKDQILEMYLNEAPYGGSFWGVGTAAMGYFGKKVSELTLAEAAILAGLPQQPSYYSPFIGKNDA